MKTKTLALALGLVCASATTAFASGYPSSGRALDQLRPANDYAQAAQGRALSLGIMRARAQGFVPSPELQVYASSVLARLLNGVPLPASFQPQVRVLAAPEFAALCTPDGTIVITIGLLEQLDNEDELAFVLGHEVSHAIYRHHKADWYNKSQYYAVLGDSGILGATKHFSLTINNFSTDSIGQAADLIDHVQKLSHNVFAPQMERDQEDAADALGFDLMVKAGYDPEAAFAVMDKLGVQEEQAAAEAKAEKNAAHRSRSSQSSGGGGGLLNGLLGGGNWAGMIVSAFDGAVDTLADQSTAHHPAPEREQLLSNYIYSNYRNVAFADPTPLPWSSASNSSSGPAIGAVLSHYADAEDGAAFIAELQDDKHSRATPPQASVSRAVLTPTQDHAYTDYVAAEYYDYQKDPAQSEAALFRAVNGPEPSWQIYSRLLDIYIARKDWTSAQKLADQAVTRFDNSPVLLPKRIQIMRGAGDKRGAEGLVGECKKYGFDELTAQCKAADD